MYQLNVPPAPEAVSVTEPGPHLFTGVLVDGADGIGLTVTVVVAFTEQVEPGVVAVTV